MIHIVFKNLDESEIAKEAVYERLQTTLDRFPDLEGHHFRMTLSMDNSQFKPGPDLFNVKLVITGKKYGGVIIEKSSSSLYVALAELSQHTLERLNRFSDKKRVRNRALARKVLELKQFESIEEIKE